MNEDETIELIEDRVPLGGIAENASELVELYGGTVDVTASDSISFRLPARRGVAASGSFACRLQWAESEDGGLLTLQTDRASAAPTASRIALLLAGAVGSVIFLLWPFFPAMAPLSWIGGAIAFAAYFLTTRRAPHGIAYDWLQRLARAQRDHDVGGDAT